MQEDVRELILDGAPPSEIKRKAIAYGMQTLRQSGITKLTEGVTTVEEVLRTTVRDE